MLLDARRVLRDEIVDADVCIVGSGPAGLTVARELVGTGVRVCVLESGGREFDAETQALADGKVSGGRFEPLRDARRRQVGGMGNLWDSEIGFRDRLGVRAGPLDPIDFERRDWLPHSGWPFGRAHLDPYYERVHRQFGLGPFRHDAEYWAPGVGRALALDSDSFQTDVSTYVRQETFTTALPEELVRAANVAVHLWANVVEAEVTENAGEVTALRVACLTGNQFRVRAKQFVFAAGGIENARLLLLSDRVQRGGLGNGHNVVGRYFMEHQPVHGGTLHPSRRSLLDEIALYDVRHVNDVPVTGKLVPTRGLLERERLLHFGVSFLPKHARYRKARQEYPDSLAQLARAARELRRPESAGTHVRNVVRGADYIAARLACRLTGGRVCSDFNAGPDMRTGGGWSAARDASRRYSVLEVHLQAEQAPHPENRVTLDEKLDALGCRKAHLHWLWRERDLTSVRRAEELVADGLRRAGLGELRIASANGRPVLDAPGLRHHMGTTRMHENPKHGVVDAQCRVHGVSNLYIAGHSVFPTGGHVDPTLTTLAMSLRLADRLKELFAAHGGVGLRESSNTFGAQAAGV